MTRLERKYWILKPYSGTFFRTILEPVNRRNDPENKPVKVFFPSNYLRFFTGKLGKNIFNTCPALVAFSCYRQISRSNSFRKKLSTICVFQSQKKINELLRIIKGISWFSSDELINWFLDEFTPGRFKTFGRVLSDQVPW